MTTCIVPGCLTIRSGAKVSLHLFPDPSREPERHMKWVRAILSEKVLTKDPAHVFKQLRVCRTHFDEKSFNGICKKLLNSAIPSLHLGPTKLAHYQTKLMIYETKLKTILKKNSTDIQEEAFHNVDVTHEAIDLPSIGLLDQEELSVNDKIWLSPVEPEEEAVEETYELMEIEGGSQFQLVIKKDQEKVKTNNVNLKPKNNLIIKTKSLAPISLRSLHKLRNDFFKCPKKQLAQSISQRLDPLEASISRSSLESSEIIFQHTVDLQRNVSSSKSSIARQWDLAALILMQQPFTDNFNLEKFEFSQAYIYYWDKIERSYYFLNNIIETVKVDDAMDGRLMSFLLTDPIGDGGQWDMIVSIINKHGVMPKKCFPESFSCESSARMNAILKSKLREYAKQLRDLLSSGASDSDLQTKVDEQMHEIYNIVGICLGIPPATFTWEYYDNNKKYNSVGPISPIDFYEKHVKTIFNVDDKVCLVTDPRPSNEFGKGYTVDCLGNVVGGRAVFYNNQPVDVLIDLVAKSIKAGEPVWFACDLKRRKTSSGIVDLDITNYKLLFDVDVDLCLSKSDRLTVGESHATHALIISGVNFDRDGTPKSFRVENLKNSNEEKKYLTMSVQWFSEFVFQVTVDKKLVNDKILKVFEIDPKILPAWDPLGSLVL